MSSERVCHGRRVALTTFGCPLMFAHDIMRPLGSVVVAESGMAVVVTV